jgi:hypothetical protein
LVVQTMGSTSHLRPQQLRQWGIPAGLVRKRASPQEMKQIRGKQYVIHHCGSIDHFMAARPGYWLHDQLVHSHPAGDRHHHAAGQLYFRPQTLLMAFIANQQDKIF